MNLENKTYKFAKICKMVEFTAISEIFDDVEIKKIEELALRPHQCHWNSAQVAQLFKCEYCEGVFCGILDHAFNRIHRNEQTYYFDVTAYINKNDNEKPYFDVLMLRVWSYKEIFEVFRDFKMAFVTSGLGSFNKQLGTFWINDEGKVEKLRSNETIMQLTMERTNAYQESTKQE